MLVYIYGVPIIKSKERWKKTFTSISALTYMQMPCLVDKLVCRTFNLMGMMGVNNGTTMEKTG
jgi:hypothetical protein